MSTWASRLSTTPKSATSSPAVEGRLGKHRTGASLSPSSSAVASPLNAGPGVAAASASDAPPDDVREEFRRVAEKYNEESACMLRMPPDCWDLLTQYLSYVDVVALGHACRSLWVVLHERESVWWRQLAYLHQDVRDLRGGKLLCTAPLFPRPPADARATLPESLVPSPTTAPSSTTARAGVAEGRTRPFTSQPRRTEWLPMSAYERFFQERRVYVLDAHREWHFQELADVEDKATGVFTVALHDGTVDAFASPMSAEAASFSFTGSITPPPALLPRTTASAANTPIQAPMDSAQDATLNVPPSPISLMPPTTLGTGAAGASSPPPARGSSHRRTTSNQTPGASAGNSPALAPSPAPPTPPLLPRVGDPIINAHNPQLQLRIYTIEVHGARKRLYSAADVEGGEEKEEQEGEYSRRNDHRNAASGDSHTRRQYDSPSAVADPAANLAGMSEDEVLAYVMQLSLQEAQATAAPARTTPPAESSHSSPGAVSKSETDPLCWPHNHYRGGPGSASLPLSELLTVIDSINNNALDQLHHHQVRDCTAEEEPGFLRRLAETLRSAKHRRLHLGNHHRAVRNNGQTTRNRAGRSVNAESSTGGGAAFSVSATSGTGGAASPQPPQPPPPMNRMLRGFHGDLLEITEREARMVADKLLGKPNIIDDFVVFHCHDPGQLYRRLCQHSASPCADAAATDTTAATPPAALTVNQPGASAGRQVMKHGMLVSVPAPLYVDPAATTATVSDAVQRTSAASASLSLSAPSLNASAVSLRTVMRGPALTALPFFTRFFLAPELCHDGFIALLVVDVVRALVVVDKEVVSTDNPDWASPLIDRGGRVVIPGQGYNPQAYTRSDYNYVPPNIPRRRRDSD